MSRFGPGDALIGLGLIALVMAALLPSYRARAFDRMVEGATADVEALRSAMTRAYSMDGTWPAAAEPGRVPSGASGAFDGDSMARSDYTLEWRLWNRVETVPAPPRPPTPPPMDEDESPPLAPVPGDAPPDSVGPELMRVARTEGAIVVHSGRDLLLAELLRRYGEEISFVRDSTWTLMLTREAEDGPSS